jgi:hypothetical protein
MAALWIMSPELASQSPIIFKERILPLIILEPEVGCESLFG